MARFFSGCFPYISLWLLGGLAYFNALGNEFVFDDIHVILENYYIKHIKFLPEIFTRNYFLYFGEQSYRPVVTFTYFGDYWLWGLYPLGFHLDNLLLHLVNSTLFLTLLNRLFPHKNWVFFAAGIWTLHPTMTEAVNSMGFREDLLVVMFALASLNFFLKAETLSVNSTGRVGFFRFLALFSFALGLFAKESMIIFPILLIGVRIQNKSSQTDARTKSDKTFLFFMVAVLIIYLYIRFYGFKSEIVYDAQTAPFTIRMLTGISILGYYLKLFFFPFPLSAEYTFPESKGVELLRALFTLLVLIFISIKIWRSKNHGLRLGWFWLLVTFIPTSNLYPIAHPVAERYLYFPFLGAAVAFSAGWGVLRNWGGFVYFNRRVIGFNVLAILVLTVFGVLTHHRNFDWKNADTLWRQTVSTAPRSYRVWNGVGIAFMGRNEFEESIKAFQHSLEMNPKNPRVYVNMGQSYHLQGKHLKAEEVLTKGLKLFPENPEMIANLGQVKQDLGKFFESRNLVKQALEINPYLAEAYVALGNMEIKLDRQAQALKALKKAAEIRPEFPEPWNNIGVLMGEQKRYSEAVAAFQKALQADPENREALTNMAAAYYFSKDYENARKYAKIAKDLGVTLPDLLSPLFDRI